MSDGETVAGSGKINAGDEWDYALDFTGKMDVAGNSGTATIRSARTGWLRR